VEHVLALENGLLIGADGERPMTLQRKAGGAERISGERKSVRIKWPRIAADRAMSWYICDLFKPDVDLRIDICNINLPDHSFDLVLCLHVLEHVPDDRKAMAELRRILRPSGMAVIMVPLEKDSTRPTRIPRSCPKPTA
jgi:SAM-dependent methyltransferase